jgi:hypothetical protein
MPIAILLLDSTKAQQLPPHQPMTLHQALITILLIVTTQTTFSLPTPPQSWAAHKRALMQLQNDLLLLQSHSNTTDGGNSSATATTTASTDKKESTEKYSTTTKPLWPILDFAPTYLATGPTTRPPTPLPSVVEPTPTPIPPLTTTTATAAPKTEALLNLLLSRVQEQSASTGGCNIPSIAQALVQQYKNTWSAGEISFTELKNRYLARYNEVEHEIRRMDRLGELILTLQHMLLTDPGSEPPHHHYNPPFRHPHHHHNRRRPGRGMELKRVLNKDIPGHTKEA